MCDKIRHLGKTISSTLQPNPFLPSFLFSFFPFRNSAEWGVGVGVGIDHLKVAPGI